MGGESSACWPQNRGVPSARQELCPDARKDPPLARWRSEGACPQRSYRPGWQTALDQAGLAVTEPGRRLCKLLLLMPDQPLLALSWSESWSELRLVEVLSLIVAHAEFVSAGLRRCRRLGARRYGLDLTNFEPVTARCHPAIAEHNSAGIATGSGSFLSRSDR
jgi:hypothetical protein